MNDRMNLARYHEPYTDSYFLRSLFILQKEKLNPFVRAQVFIRNGPGIIKGITEVLEIIQRYSALLKNSGRVFALQDGMTYIPSETVLLLEGRIQDIITLETMVLGVISAKTTKANDKIPMDYKSITKNCRQIVQLIADRQLLYFGARHWSFNQDKKITQAAIDGGAHGASTDVGASVIGKKGLGTIPHSLQCVYAWKFGYDHAVVKSIKAFDRWIDRSVPRIALVDFRNKEIDDTLACVSALGDRLDGVRIDTCGENYMQKVQANEDDLPYWSDPGVSIRGVLLVRKALDAAGFYKIKIVLSSGFGDIQKVRAFVEAEKDFGIRLFDSLGIGQLFPARSATMDIVSVGANTSSLEPIAKTGRVYKPNSRLRRV